MGLLADLVQQNTATTGTGAITLGSAVTGFRTVAGAGIADGSVVSYAIQDGTNRETGTGTVGASGTTLTRVLRASSTGSLLNLSGSAVVAIAPNADDFSTNLSYTASTRALASSNGTGFTFPLFTATEAGLVPLSSGGTSNFLRADGAWGVPPSDVYPPSNFGPRYRSWLMDPNDALNFASNAGPFGDRYFLGQDQTVTWSRVLIPSGNGRVALRRQITNFSPQDAGFIRGQSGNNFILDPDAGAVWRWKARVNLRPNGQPAPDQITNRYTYVGGFSTWTPSAIFANNCAVFRYYYDTSAESPALRVITRRNGVGQATDLVSTIVDGFITFEVVMSATQVLYYINGALVATHTIAPDGALNDGDGFWREGHTGTVIMDLAYMATSVSWGNDV